MDAFTDGREIIFVAAEAKRRKLEGRVSWSVDVETEGPEGQRELGARMFPTKSEAEEFITCERGRLAPRDESILSMTKAEHGVATGHHVMRVYAYEIRDLLEKKTWPSARDLFREYLRLRALAVTEDARHHLSVGLCYSLDELSEFKDAPRDSPLRIIRHYVPWPGALWRIETEAGVPLSMEARIAGAMDFGRRACLRGAECAPILDKEFPEKLWQGLPLGESIPILTAWHRGWTRAALERPGPDDSSSGPGMG